MKRIVLLSLAVSLIAVPAVTNGAPSKTARRSAKSGLPHHQDQPPGPALSPAEAIQKMRVPDGFTVELVASEPDIVNPVAMTFDERGRIWITESLEYPRKSSGPGRDRVKILEDTDGDGKADKFTVFADGLNIPSGIAVGHGGVWVANSPDILFMQDTDGDGKADRREIVATGFGRRDTHELPNSLTWGPDGWLYGLNGVFNESRVRSGEKDFKFTCAMFRIHPRTREFQLFCEGTSNPWGIAWDEFGSAFVSACVIDHLWHLVETGYYHRQGGPYPPFAWKIDSIVAHKHQKAAYCGLHYFDSDAYPPEYRRRLYMGNIHGSCVNVDTLERNGSTYAGRPAPDFLTANDAWFMPVAQKTGPDGCLYVLDWYDRYHCYQDARRDPQGIDRLKGRLYRIRYRQTPRAKPFDLAKESGDQLLARLEAAPNDYYRSVIVWLLSERRDPTLRPKLERMVVDARSPLKVRLPALWALVGSDAVGDAFLQKLLADGEPALRAWGIRACGNLGRASSAVRQTVTAAAGDPSADVRLQSAIAARKVEGLDAVSLLVSVLAHSADDPLIPHIVWNNLQPLMGTDASHIVATMVSADWTGGKAFAQFVPRMLDRLLTARSIDGAAVRELLRLAARSESPDAARACLRLVAARVQNRELTGGRLETVSKSVQSLLAPILTGAASHPLFREAILLAATLKSPAGLEVARRMASDPASSEETRLIALEALIAASEPGALGLADGLLAGTPPTSPQFRVRLLGALARIDSPRVAEMVLARYAQLDSEAQSAAIELLTQRVRWAKRLLAAIGEGAVPTHAINLSQVRKLIASGDRELADTIRAKWGTIRDGRNPQREQVIARMRGLIRNSQGDAGAGELVFRRICAQCHKIHGSGADVGPEITLNGRSSFDQLLSNVFDPSLVIGASYRAVIVVTKEGRTLTGLLVEDSPSRVSLKIQGGKTETIARDDVEVFRVSDVSLMPEQLESQLKPKEIVDLFAFLAYDKHPSDPTARQLPSLH